MITTVPVKEDVISFASAIGVVLANAASSGNALLSTVWQVGQQAGQVAWISSCWGH